MAKETDGRRVQRVEREVQQVVARFISREMKEDLPGLVTVAKVYMPGDLRRAKVFINLLNPEGEEKSCRKQAINILNSWAKAIQNELGEELDLRFTPTLQFHYDDTTEQILHVERILHDLSSSKKDDKK